MTAANVSRMPKPRKKASPSPEARQAEAEDGFVTVEQCGVELQVPVRGKVFVAVTDLFLEGDNYGATKQLLGNEQWKRLSEAGMTMDDLDELGLKLRGVWGN